MLLSPPRWYKSCSPEFRLSVHADRALTPDSKDDVMALNGAIFKLMEG